MVEGRIIYRVIMDMGIEFRNCLVIWKNGFLIINFLFEKGVVLQGGIDTLFSSL